MKTYCVKYRENTEKLNSKILKIKNGRLIMQSKCIGCGFKKSRFVKEQKVADKFMPEMHLKQSGFAYSACGPFTKNKERIEKFIQTGNMGFIE